MIDGQFERSFEKIKKRLLIAQHHGELSQEKECDVLARGILSHYLATLIYGLKNDLDIENQVAQYRALIEHQLNCH